MVAHAVVLTNHVRVLVSVLCRPPRCDPVHRASLSARLCAWWQYNIPLTRKPRRVSLLHRSDADEDEGWNSEAGGISVRKPA